MSDLVRTPAGLYLHIPFCDARCGYCDFITFTEKNDSIPRYAGALAHEIELYSRRLFDEKKSNVISTVFFGGGTPSLLDPVSLQTIFSSIRSSFQLADDAEITLEANPESVTPERIKAWKEIGINRISMGLQTTDNTLLKKIDRLHTFERFVSVFHALRDADFHNLSFDLIYGLPGQTMGDWQKTVETSLELKPDHLSLYSLTVEKNTPFAAAAVSVDLDLQGEMYEWARSCLPSSGYAAYEIANFARPGFECRHNLVYWRQQDYFGLGVGAVGCVDGMRWQNVKSLSEYFSRLEQYERPVLSVEPLDTNTRRFERLMLGLRLREGISWTDSDPSWLSERDTLAKKGWLEEHSPGRWRIPDAYVGRTNQILLPFIAS